MRIARKYLSAAVAVVFITSILIQSLSTAQAQQNGYNLPDCPTIVKQAIDTVSAECSKAGRNKLCYGNSTIQAVFQPGAGNVAFQAPGDTVDVTQIKQFTLGGMDTSTNSWGVAEMKIKADLPDTDATQNVTMILFGDVQLTDASADANIAVLTQTPGAVAHQNQYATATTNAINQQATHSAATATKITGLESTATTRAETPTPTGTISAVKATQAAATATKLAVYQATATAAPILQTPVPGSVIGEPYKGLQAFYFQSSDTAPCDQAPHDGILIQSPQGKQRVTLSVDGATISLGSTVYITAQPSKFLTVNTLEGSATITVAGQTQIARAGSAVQVPLDANLRSSGAPTTPKPYNTDTIRALPIHALPNPSITVVPGIPPNLTFATWNWTLGTFTCPDPNYGFSFDVGMALPGDLAFNDTTMWVNSPLGNGTTLILTKSGGGLYTGSDTYTLDANTYTDTYSLHVDSPTHISGTLTLQAAGDPVACVISLVLTPAS